MFQKISGLQLLSGAAILFSSLFISCEKDSLVGTGIQNDAQKYEVLELDSFSIAAQTIREDSIRTDNSNYALLGTTYDQTFGTTSASFSTKFELPQGSLDLSVVKNLRIDSAFLFLTYFDYYGNLDDGQDLRVYELTEGIIDSLNYYSNQVIPTEFNQVGQNISSEGFKPTESRFVDGEEELPSLKIPLNSEFVKRLLSMDESAYADNGAFGEAFKGLQVRNENPSSNTGAIFRFLPFSEFSRMKIYFTDEFYAVDSLNQHYNIEFPIGPSQDVVNTITHDEYSNSSVLSKLGSEEAGKDRVYVQSGGGLKVEINIPYLESLSSLKPTIHKASLVFPVVNETVDFPIHSRLFLSLQDSAQQAQFIPIYAAEPFGGSYNSSIQAYEFNVSKYVQGIIDGDYENKEWVLTDEAGYVTFSHNTFRTILEGSEGESRIKLNLTLSIPE